MELDYDKDYHIDEQALDVEWLEHGNIAKKYIRHLVQKKKEAALASEKVKTVRSELILRANEHPEECCGKSKPNAADIEAFYRTNKQYRRAKEKYLEAQEEAEFAELAQKEICYTRRTTLENLVKLHGQMYFAGPSMPRDLTEERNKIANQKIGKKMNRTKKG